MEKPPKDAEHIVGGLIVLPKAEGHEPFGIRGRELECIDDQPAILLQQGSRLADLGRVDLTGRVAEPVLMAVEQVGRRGLGRIRMRHIPDASADSLQGFVEEAIEPGSLVHTDGWVGYDRLEKRGYRHRITVVKGRRESTADLLPRVHRVVSLLKRWLLGTHQGAVRFAHLDCYLAEFTFRFNRRTSRSRGKLFYRLVQQAVAVEPVPYKRLIATDHYM